MSDSKHPSDTDLKSDHSSPIEKEEHHATTTTQVNEASVALAAAIAQQKPKLWTPNMIRLYAIMSIGYLVSTMNGFDSSLMGAINAMEEYHESFGLAGQASTKGMIFIIYNLGQIASFPFCGLFADGLGRRWCIFIGCLIVVVGTAVQTTANSMEQFIGGRFVLGFGASIASAAGPAVSFQSHSQIYALLYSLRILTVHGRACASRVQRHHGRNVSELSSGSILRALNRPQVQ